MKNFKNFAKVIAICIALVGMCSSATAIAQTNVFSLSNEAQDAVKGFFGMEKMEVYKVETSDIQEIGKFLLSNPQGVCLLDEASWEDGDSIFVQRVFIGLKDKEKRVMTTFSLIEKKLSPREKAQREIISSQIVDLSNESTVKEEIIAGGEARIGTVAFAVYEDGGVDFSAPISMGAKNIYYWQIAPVVGMSYDLDGQWTPYFGVELARWGKSFGGYIQGKLGWAYYPETAEKPGKSYLTGGAQMGLGARLWSNNSENKNLWVGAFADAMWYSTDTKRPDGDEYRWATQDGLSVGPGGFIKWRMPFFELSLNYSYTRVLGYDMAEWHHNVALTLAVPIALWRNSTK